MKSYENDFDIKIIDFGISSFCSRPMLRESVGTLHYAAPELLEGRKYGKMVDNWALGCILYALLAGKLPVSH